MLKPIRVAVSGAAGLISYSLLFRIAAGGLFGPNQPVALSLLEAPEGMRLLDATLMELSDCAFPLLVEAKGSDEPAVSFRDADWVILVGGSSAKAEMTRSDLLLANGPIFQQQGRAINEVCPAARILVVANPCNTNCLIAKSVASNVPSEHWFAMTRLDQSRARSLLAARAGVNVEQVTRVTVWGNQSDGVYPDFHNSWIGERPAPEVITDAGWVRDVFELTVRQRERHLQELRGASPAGSAAQAIIATIRSLTTPTPYEHRFSVAVPSDGSYGIPRGLVYGFPVRTEDGQGYSIVQGLFLDDYAQDRLQANVAELEYEASAVTDLLGKIG